MSVADRSVARASDDVPALVFAALGDPTRLELVRRLGDGQSHPIIHLAANLSVTRQAVSRHLTVLRDAGVVADEHIGREHLYRLRPTTLRTGRDYLDRAATQWDDALDRLRRFVQDDEVSQGGDQ